MKDIWSKITANKPLLIVAIIIPVLLLCFCCFIIFVGSSGNRWKMGNISYKIPDQKYIQETKSWGTIPVNQFLVLLPENSDLTLADKVAKSVGGKITGEFGYLNLYQIETSNTDKFVFKDQLEKLSNDTNIIAVSPNYPLYLKFSKVEPCTLFEDIYTTDGNNKEYSLIGADKAWKYIHLSGLTLNNVHVGVTDSGLNTTSPEIKGKSQIYTLDKSDENNIPDTDRNGNIDTGYYNHGTAVTNVIGADWSNGGIKGIAGGLGNNLKISMANLQVNKSNITKTEKISEEEDISRVDYNGYTYTLTTFADIKRQIDNGATIINYSWGPDKPDQKYNNISKVFQKFLEKLNKNHPEVLIVAAAGNEKGELDGNNYGMGGIIAPNLITVGALEDNGNKASFSNFSNNGNVTISAIGRDVPVALDKKSGLVTRVSGTSFATPQVTAAAAILRSINPDLTAEEIKNILTETASTEINNKDISSSKIAVDKTVGGKVLRIDEAVLNVLNQQRKKNNLKSKDLTAKDFENKQSMNAVVETDSTNPLYYTIKLTLNSTSPKGTTIKVDAGGSTGSFIGKWERQFPKPGEATWNYEFSSTDEHANIKFNRTDVNDCISVYIKPEKLTKPIPTQTSVPTKIIVKTPVKTVFQTPKPTIYHTPVPTKAPTAIPNQVVSTCGLCASSGLDCACGKAACRCCAVNDINCNAYDL